MHTNYLQLHCRHQAGPDHLQIASGGPETYFDVRVLNPLAPSNRNLAPMAVYRKHELEKKQAYQQWIKEVEHSSFTLFVLSATGGMGNEATIFYKCLASLLAQKWDFPYSTTLC